MATLVLTAAGAAIGGPIGAAVGGVLGQAIDRNVLLAPRARQGPRLSDLKVQTSSYGTQIPKVFGTMRVAGCVIWATELIETRSTTRGGKGRAGATGYAYAASFAVALSARPIAAVGRIWAEGKLLRGAAGDWKTPTGFRLYHGGEEQRADPLIASLNPDAPACRGIAYAVFENLALADFGNRIPSLSFEVIGDPVPPSIGRVAHELGGGAVVGVGPGALVAGYAASGESVGVALDALATIAGAWWVPAGPALRLADVVGVPVAIDADAVVTELRRPIETVPARVTVSCYDPARDYQIGVQQAQRPGRGWRDMDSDVPAALDAAMARGLAQTLLRRAERARVTRRVTLDATAVALAPGDALHLRDGGAPWRVTRAEAGSRGVTLDLTPTGIAAVALPADPGRMVPAPDRRAAATVLVAAELPPLDDVRAETIRIAVLAGGDAPGWRGAGLMMSGDGGASWEAAGYSAAAAVLGRLASPVGGGQAWLVDRATTIEVELAHDGMTLASVSDAALDRGENAALLGEEVFQFRDAVQVAARRWRLSTLLRGRRGSRARAQIAGAAFALIEDACIATIAVPRARIGDTVRLLASGAGDAQPVAVTVSLSGASVAPPSPVRLRIEPRSDGGAAMRWVRRSRLGWRWADGMDVPLGEERERYTVTLGTGAVARTLGSEVPLLTMAAGDVRVGDTVTVRQLGTFAPSMAAESMFEGDG